MMTPLETVVWLLFALPCSIPAAALSAVCLSKAIRRIAYALHVLRHVRDVDHSVHVVRNGHNRRRKEVLE